jgi:hypothetical protein
VAGVPLPVAGSARVSRIAAATFCARSWTSTALARGLATVSISAEVSPKSFLNWSETPSGKPFRFDSLSQMSSNSLAVSATVLSRVMVTTETPARVVDSSFSIFEFSASWRSITRVTRSSTLRAVAPGQDARATAARTGISGSLRFGIVA